MRSKWRKAIDKLDIGESVRFSYYKESMTLRKYVSYTIQNQNKAKYSVKKLGDTKYEVIRKA